MTEDLFSQNAEAEAPLSYRLRPQTLEEFAGQEHLLGPGKILAELTKSPFLPSLILWGPPGCGKTTLAHLLAKKKNHQFIPLSAVMVGVGEVRKVVEEAEETLKLYGKKTVLFLDEIHRFNKAQQDALLPHVEKGTIILIGATTENPSFEVIGPLLSRCRLVVLNKLKREDLRKILGRALKILSLEGASPQKMDEAACEGLCELADGDARRMLNTLETAAVIASPKWAKQFPEVSREIAASPEPAPSQGEGAPRNDITMAHIETALEKKALLYDKKGEEHYNVISAFIKSMRGSDPDAAVYYLARMLEAGEEPLFVARRMVIFASEDVGNADPQAVQVAMSCMQSFDFVGWPEGWIPLAQAATYLASAPKSNASYRAYLNAKEDVEKEGALPVPLHLRNAPTKLMKQLDYGKGYQYAHNDPEHIVSQQHLPDKLKGKKYYRPTDIGYEKIIREWLARVAAKKGDKG